jgi:dolichyl-phosphate-mannose--protein O-mannosyl transferase
MGAEPALDTAERSASRRRVILSPARPAPWSWHEAGGAIAARVRAWLAAGGRLDALVMALLVVVSLGITLPRLATPERYFYDEILYAYTAREYLQGNPAAHRWDDPCAVGRNGEVCLASNAAARVGARVGKFEWTHPPLGKLVIAGGIAVLGDTPHGRRLPGAVVGAVGIALLYRLGIALTRRRGIALLGAALLMLDGLWFVESRLALPDVFLAVAVLGATVALSVWLAVPPAAGHRPLVVVGLLLGLGLATKWSAAYVWVLVYLVVGVRIVAAGQFGREDEMASGGESKLAAQVVWAVIALLGVPLGVYAAAHLPFFATGNGLADFVELQRQRWLYHRSYDAEFAYASSWWQWPLALRPAWYGATTFGEDGRVASVYANGNPLLYWAFLPALLWVGWRWWQQRRGALLIFLIGVLGAWLPWAAIERPTFVYHFLPAVPFCCLAVAVAVSDLYHADTGWRRTLAVEYVVLVALAFAFFYPLYAFVGLDAHDLELRLWLPSWR